MVIVAVDPLTVSTGYVPLSAVVADPATTICCPTQRYEVEEKVIVPVFEETTMFVNVVDDL